MLEHNHEHRHESYLDSTRTQCAGMWSSHIYITLHMDITHIHHTSHAFVICICVYVRSTLGISLDALNLSLYAAIARAILFIVSGNSVPKRTGEQAAPRCDLTW